MPLPHRCIPSEHARVWKDGRWVCSTCLITGSESSEVSRGADNAASYEQLMTQKQERDRKVRLVVE